MRASNIFGLATLSTVLIAIVSAQASYANGVEVIYYGTIGQTFDENLRLQPTGPQFGVI